MHGERRQHAGCNVLVIVEHCSNAGLVIKRAVQRDAQVGGCHSNAKHLSHSACGIRYTVQGWWVISSWAAGGLSIAASVREHGQRSKQGQTMLRRA